MIKKEISVSELIGILSILALGISVLSNAFFYYSLDALWVMSILSPTFYITEIVKVLIIISLVICTVGVLIDIYQFLFKKYIKRYPKKRLLFDSVNDHFQLKKQFEKSSKRFIRWQAVFVIGICISCLMIFLVFQIIGASTFLWSCILISITFSIFTDANVRKDKQLRYFILIILSIFTTCFSAQLKLNQIEDSPIAVLKQEDQNTWFVIDSFQDKVIIFSQFDKKSNIKVVKFEEIARIRSEK